MISGAVNQNYEAVAVGFDPGLLGVIGVRLEDGEGNIVMARRTTGIIESPAGSSIYTTTLPFPATPGTFTLVWDDGAGVFTAEQVEVTSVRPPLPPSPGARGFCSYWTDADAITACCEPPEGADLDYAAELATDLLFALSGHRYPGRCLAIVRPQNLGNRCWPGGAWDRPYWPHGCRRLGRVKLAGYPVSEIVEVKLDGLVLDAAEYRLFGSRYLMRATDNETWPSCQYLERDSAEEGTFQVTYLYGQDPPVSGQLAAAKLACEIAKACVGADCDLPANAVRVIRQGVTLSMAGDAGERTSGASSALRGPLGLAEVDAFLSATPGPRRRSAVVSPDSEPYPLVVSVEPAPPEEGS